MQTSASHTLALSTNSPANTNRSIASPVIRGEMFANAITTVDIVVPEKHNHI